MVLALKHQYNMNENTYPQLYQKHLRMVSFQSWNVSIAQWHYRPGKMGANCHLRASLMPPIFFDCKFILFFGK